MLLFNYSLMCEVLREGIDPNGDLIGFSRFSAPDRRCVILVGSKFSSSERAFADPHRNRVLKWERRHVLNGHLLYSQMSCWFGD